MLFVIAGLLTILVFVVGNHNRSLSFQLENITRDHNSYRERLWGLQHDFEELKSKYEQESGFYRLSLDRITRQKDFFEAECVKLKEKLKNLEENQAIFELD
jgi:hypothetical protein